jgi:hypothetical protein
MTTLQKSLITAVITAGLGTGIYEACQAFQLRGQVQMLQQQQAPLAAQIQKLRKERDNATNQLTKLARQLADTKRNESELLKLRGEVGMLKTRNKALALESANMAQNNQAHGLSNGFGALGNYIAMENVSNAGNRTPEAALQTLLYAFREGKTDMFMPVGPPGGGQAPPGEAAGQLSDEEAAARQMLMNIFTNSAGFNLNSSLANDGQQYQIRLDPVPIDAKKGSMQDMRISLVLNQTADGWVFAPASSP